MSEFTKVVTISFEFVYESEEGESEKEFEKRIRYDVNSLDLKGFECNDITIEDAY